MPDPTPIDRIALVVARSPKGDAPAQFEVPVPSAASRVLDALLYVRHNLDSTLGFRYACRAGMCGSCAVVINGREGLACQTTVASLGARTVSVGPLRSLPVQKDLMVDMKPFFDSFKRAGAAFRPAEPTRRNIRTLPPGDPDRMLVERQNGCITCGACYSACEWSASRPDYLGPATLNRLLMLSLDVRDAQGVRRLAVAATDAGVLRCHALGSCTQVCPVEVPVREGMQKLKGLLATRKIEG